MIEEASQLIQLGMPIIPLCPPDHLGMSQNHISRCKCPGKMPLIKDWQTKTTTTIAELQSWQKQFKAFNIGMPLGDASGYCGIDVDGEAGIELLMQMSKGDLPSTWEFNTSAGSRLLYKIPEGLKTKKFKQSGTGPHEECALICTGQQTVMPPSMHASGVTYQWVKEHSPWDMSCAMAPQWLINSIRIDSPNETIAINTVSAPTFTLKEVASFEEEFGSSDNNDEFTVDLTADFFNVPSTDDLAQAKAPERAATHKKTVTEDMLTQPIPEGQRDTTMTAIVGHYCANADLRRLGKQTILQICLDHNQKYCVPPLEDQAILDKVEYFYQIEQQKTEEYASKKSNKPVFTASTQAKNVLQYLQNQNIILEFDCVTKTYYYCQKDSGPWRSTQNTLLINRWIRDVVKSPHYGDTSWDKRSYIEETRTAMEESFASLNNSTSKFDIGSHSKELCKYIVINGQMLDWKTGELLDWDPNYRTTIAYETFVYDPYAKCPNFKQYLSEWLPDEGVRKTVQEFLGYCLLPDTTYRKALYLYGKGRNGKSIFLEMLQDFFQGMSSSLSYDGLFQRFGTAQLQNKIINIYDDTTISFAKDTGTAKNIIAGGKLTAERKGKDAFEFINVARLIYSAQEMPRTADTSLAWFDRWFFVKFPNTFPTSGKNKLMMQATMQDEYAGIFNWMIEGLTRLHQQGHFSHCAALDNSTLEYRGLNDNVVQFISSWTVTAPTTDPMDRHSASDWYKLYVLFIEKEGLRKVSRKVFRVRMEDLGFELIQGNVQKSQKTAYYKDLVLNNQNEDVINYALDIQLALLS